MTIRKEYKLTEEQLESLLKCSEPVPYMVFGGIAPKSPRERAEARWEQLGVEMGFKFRTVQPVPGKGHEYFTAISTESET